MNKKFIKVVFVAAIALVGGINVFNAQKTNDLSDFVLANVEALAKVESDGTTVCTGTYYVCASEYDSFCNDMERNCNIFSGTIIRLPEC